MKFKYNVTTIRGDKIPIIDILITNSQNNVKVTYPCLVDSGAFMSVFHSEVAEALGIDLESIKEICPFGGVGKAKRTLIGKPYCVKLMVVSKGNNKEFDSMVLFSEDIDPNGYPILGRLGFFDRFDEISFDIAKGKFYLCF